MGNWGPLPSWGPPPTLDEQKRAEAVRALLRLALDARYYLGGGNGTSPSRRPISDEWAKMLGWTPSSPKAFERARALLHQRLEDALLGIGDPSYLHFVADQLAFFERRKDLPALPRGDKATTIIEECFVRLWTEGDNWLTRKQFFQLCSREFQAQNCHPIGYYHFVRILENTGLDEYFPRMRRGAPNIRESLKR